MNACSGRCNQGRACTCCAPLITRNGGQRIDTDLMLSKGSITGPHRKTKPRTVTLGNRIVRALQRLIRAADAWQVKRKASK